jgi:hypothetical protein
LLGGRPVKDVKDIEYHDKVVFQLLTLAQGKEIISESLVKELHKSLFPSDGGEYKSDINFTGTRYGIEFTHAFVVILKGTMIGLLRVCNNTLVYFPMILQFIKFMFSQNMFRSTWIIC